MIRQCSRQAAPEQQQRRAGPGQQPKGQHSGKQRIRARHVLAEAASSHPNSRSQNFSIRPYPRQNNTAFSSSASPPDGIFYALSLIGSAG